MCAGNIEGADGTLINGDITAPELTLVGDEELWTEKPDAAFLDEYLHNGAAASDHFDGELEVVCAFDKSLQDPLPGDYRFSYSAADQSGNISELMSLVHFTGPNVESGYIALRVGASEVVSTTETGLAAAGKSSARRRSFISRIWAIDTTPCARPMGFYR